VGYSYHHYTQNTWSTWSTERSNSILAVHIKSRACTKDFDEPWTKLQRRRYICFIQTMATYSGSIIGTSNKMNSICSCNVMENHQNASKLVVGRLAKRTVLLFLVLLSSRLGRLDRGQKR